ncbi:hypothetical protein MTR_8g036030 [Medicago truncatula]|uniref:Uncharacterized protein n=1 Tax=Medicago truncatula TaxID=3880 RepID=A0A072TPA1_MEDTR|nr:hypothetical protein MTR_8g036030 [Medicago truncatula]
MSSEVQALRFDLEGGDNDLGKRKSLENTWKDSSAKGWKFMAYDNLKCFIFKNNLCGDCKYKEELGLRGTPTGAGDRPLAEIRLNRVTMHSNPLAG